MEHELYHSYDKNTKRDLKELYHKVTIFLQKLKGDKQNGKNIFSEENKDENFLQTMYTLYQSDLGELGAKLQGYSYRVRQYTLKSQFDDFKTKGRGVLFSNMKDFKIDINSWSEEQKEQFKEEIEEPTDELLKKLQKQINDGGKEYDLGLIELEKLVKLD